MATLLSERGDTGTVKKETASFKDEDVLALARRRFDIAKSDESDRRTAALEDIQFANNVGDGQWPESIKREREAEDRPCLTVNKLRKFIKQLVGDQRQNRPSIKVVGVDNNQDPVLAKIYTDLIRNIEYQSSADVAYDTAYEHSVSGGFGYYKIIAKHVDDGFDQELLIKRIKNQFSVYYDPNAQEFDYSDARYCFVTSIIPQDEFITKYPNARAYDFDSYIGEEYEGWFEENKVRVADYYFKVPYNKTIAQLITGEIIELTDKITKEYLSSIGQEIVREREVKSHKVKHYKITGAEILKKTDWPGKYIPVIPVLGDEVVIQGKKYLRSLIRDAKDPQRLYNFWRTCVAEIVALAPKAPFLLTPAEIKNHEKMWKNANKKNYPYLLYNSKTGKVPQRQQAQGIPAGAVHEASVANFDLKDTTGMYEAGMGEKSNERSGRAIMARQKRSDTGTFTFIDNLRRSIIYGGRQLLDLIPKIYDTERILRLRGEDGMMSSVVINKVAIVNGEEVIVNDLSVGKFDVRAAMGSSYSSKRQEAADSMLQFLQYAPDAAPYILDLVAEMMDWPMAEEVAKRLKKLVPPEVKEDGTQNVPPSLVGNA